MANGNGFNPLDVIENLQNVGVPAEQAKILARALSQVAESTAATKQDLEMTKMELKRDIVDIKRDLKELEQRLIIRLGGIMAGIMALGVGIIALIVTKSS